MPNILGLGSSIIKGERIVRRYATRFASFNGSSSKALAAPGRLPPVLAGSGTLGENITFSMWIKATWTIPASPPDAVVNTIPFFMLGNDSDVHESFRMYYMIEDGSANNKNDLVMELRSTTGANARQNEIMRLSASGSPNNATITGSSAADHEKMWDSDNSAITTNSDGFVHIICSRGTLDWKIFWNGQECEIIDNDSGSLNTDVSLFDSFSIGYWEYSDTYGQLGVRDFAIYNSQLSGSDVTALYNGGVLADHRNLIVPQPIVYYPFEEDGNDVMLSTGPNFTLTNVTFEDI